MTVTSINIKCAECEFISSEAFVVYWCFCWQLSVLCICLYHLVTLVGGFFVCWVLVMRGVFPSAQEAPESHYSWCPGHRKYIYCVYTNITETYTLSCTIIKHVFPHPDQFHEVFGLSDLLRNRQEFIVADHKHFQRKSEEKLGENGQLISTENIKTRISFNSLQ